MKKFLTPFLSTSLLLPLFVYGASTSTTSSPNDFCSNIDKILIAVNGKLPDQARATDTRKQVSAKADQALFFTQQIKTFQKYNDAILDKELAFLTTKATTDSEKNALATLISTVREARDTKNRAIMSLISTGAIQQTAYSPQDDKSKQALYNELYASINTAKEKALADCHKGVKGENVRSALKSSLMQAEETFKKTNTPSSKNKKELQIEADFKKQELKKIEGAFKKSIEDAVTIYRQSLRTTK